MNDEQDELHKPDSSERRLRLRKDYKESTDNKANLSGDSNNECKKNNTVRTSQSSCDDSILDFKSPKKYSLQSKNINSNKFSSKSKKNVSHAKIKIINNRKKPETNKLLQNRKLDTQQQPSIESSFFKTEKKVDLPQNSADIKTAYVCPLCFKNLKDESSQAAHMKCCAMKNNISTKKLLDAVELQERQAAERKSLGLLTAPILQDKKKPIPRKMASHDDPDLQLALALSKSLYEKEEMEIWDEAEMAVASSSSLPDSNKEYFQGTTLQSFGFTSSRSMSPTNNHLGNKMKRRKLIEPTTLQRRTAIERERILTERIAEILMGYRDFTQKFQEEKKQPNTKEKIVIKSQLLQDLYQIEDTLWDKTSLILTQNSFYVKQLSPQIISLPEKEILIEEQNVINQNVNDEESFESKELEDIKEVQAIDTANSSEESTIPLDTIKTCCEEKRFLDTLAINWRNILNDSSASDIIVLVKNNRHIWTHKLVFYVRCTNILLDVISNDTQFSTAKEKICWIDIEYDIALAFLEFVYCGIIDRYSKILDSDMSLSGIRSLARRYKVNDLFTYLRQKRIKSNLTEVKYDYNSCEKDTENANMEKISSISELNKTTFYTSSNHPHDSKNIQCSQKTLLQVSVNNIFASEDNSVRNSGVLQDEGPILLKSEKVISKSNTPINRETSVSPDIFDDMPNVTKYEDNKSIIETHDHEDSNINVLLNLIKQDTDIDICNQKSITGKTHSTEHSKPDEDISIVENAGQSVMEIDSDSNSNSPERESANDTHKTSLVDTLQDSASKSIQNFPPNIAKQKGNLTLFIEKMQRINSKSDSDLDSDLDITIRPVQISPGKRLNPFHLNEYSNSDNEDTGSCDDNIKQSTNTKKKLGCLSVIEQRMQSYANKNPEFYSRLSNECKRNIMNDNGNRTSSLIISTSSDRMTNSSRTNAEIYTQNFIPSIENDINISEQMATTPVCSSHIKTANQSPSESICDLERDEKEISMYSQYMRNHKDNSIAKYRSAIKKNRSDSSLSNESISSDSPSKSSKINTNKIDKALTQSIFMQEDTDVIVSDTEIENTSSSGRCSVISQDDDTDCENAIFSFAQQSKQTTEDNKENDQIEINEIPKITTIGLEDEKDINNVTKSVRDKSITNDGETTSDHVDFSMIFTQTKARLNEPYEKKTDDYENELVSSPITVSSSPDFLNTEISLADMEHYSKQISETDNHKSRRSAEFSFNFEEDIYLANVDVDKYEKRHILEKSQSASVLNIMEFKNKSNARDHKNIADNNIAVNDASVCANVDRNAISLTQNAASIRKFRNKSLSEGQININRLRNQAATSNDAPVQFRYNYVQNIGNVKTKVIDKDVTPPPAYNDMGTPELHKEMKRYGLKAQKRSRAVKLLTHIYNELHPLVSATEITTRQKQVTEISSDEDEGPPLKRPNTNVNSLDKSNNAENSDDELAYSQDSNVSTSSVKGTMKEMEFYETDSLPALENSSDIREAFTRLININKDLHNKILRYEPLNIEKLHAMLRAHAFKCKLPNLMSFLDEQCITFCVPEQSVRSRTRRKT